MERKQNIFVNGVMTVFLKASSSEADKSSAIPVASYATYADFCNVFRDNVDRLYMLSLLLTGDEHMAEECFLAAFENCLDSKTVFKEWAQSWARRTMIQTAIRIAFSQTPPSKHYEFERIERAISGTEILMARVSRLAPVERFVYVLCVLERISDKECSLLLDCSLRDVMDAKSRALEATCKIRTLRHPNHEEGPSVWSR